MVPGAIASRAILAAFALSSPQASKLPVDLVVADAISNALRVSFTLGAIGTGVAIPVLLIDRFLAGDKSH